MSRLECPYCGSDHTQELPDEGCYHCNECGDDFFFEDTIREPVRHAISSILFQHAERHHYRHDEDNPMEFDHPLLFPSVIGIFETQDGIIFFNPCDGGEPIEFDDMDTADLTKILHILELDFLEEETAN